MFSTRAHFRTSAPPHVHTSARTYTLVLACLLAARITTAQVRQPDDTISAGEGAHILSDVSTNVGAGSRPIHDDSLTVGETSGGPVGAGPVSEASTRSMVSGPVSSISQGPMRDPRPLPGGSVSEASAGAVKHDIASPLGERISDPLRELGPLQKEMRARREAAEQAALVAATEPAVPAIADSAASAEAAGADIAVEAAPLPPVADEAISQEDAE